MSSTNDSFAVAMDPARPSNGSIQISNDPAGGQHKAAHRNAFATIDGNEAAAYVALIRHGFKHLATVERELAAWMEEHEYDSVAQLKGSLSQKNCTDPSTFERAQYRRAISRFQSAG